MSWVGQYLHFWFCSARYQSRRFISMDIYAPLAPAQGRRAHKWGTGAVRADANGAHEWRRNLLRWAALARRPPARVVWRLHQQRYRWTKANALGTRRRRLQRDEGPHNKVVPRSNGEKRPRLPEKNKTSFFMGPTLAQQEVGIRLYRQSASRISLKRGYSHLAMLDPRVFVVFGTNTA